MTDLRPAMFEQAALPTWRPPRTLAASIAGHLVLFGVLLYGRTPIFVAPSSALAGAHGTAITHIYWSAAKADSSTEATQPREKTRLARKPPLIWKGKQQTELASETPQATTPSAPAPSAGSPYGSMSNDASEGAEVRPALPARTFEPRVSPEYLHGINEGNVVVEITIDETGKIVSKTVVQSMGSAIDSTVLAALENWLFHPATRDGVPIPSRQDVVYHFKPI
jgi:TonB family protein